MSNIQPSRRNVGTGPDTDGDGLSDDYERNVFGSDPNQRDPDGDGLNDWAEWWLDTNPNQRDTDGDGFEDGEDLAFGDPLRANAGGAERAAFVERARKQFEAEGSDRDKDLARDHVEASEGTKDDDPDSDNDGLGDMVELQLKTNPLSPAGDTSDLDTARERIGERREITDRMPGSSSTSSEADTDPSFDAYEAPAFEQPSFDEATADSTLYAEPEYADPEPVESSWDEPVDGFTEFA